MADTSNGNDEDGADVPNSEGDANDSGNINAEPTVQPDKTSGNYIKKMLKVPLDELKIRKTVWEAFSATVDYPEKIVEVQFIILDTDGCPVQVHFFPVESEVKVMVDALKKYDPAYNESVRSKLCLKKIPLIFELFNNTYHCRMTQYKI